MISRPEVDSDRIGITGASGGVNQTMYAGAWDERLKAVVPVCSVGNYQAYLGAACCMCEVVPSALQFTEEANILSLVAPRALMVVSATKDAFQFSVGEATKSIDGARPVFELHNCSDKLCHAVFESPHDYNQPMREAMYGWMTLHLKGEGTGQPIPEPAMETEAPETLRCYPGTSRPDHWITIPEFAASEARRLIANKQAATDASEMIADLNNRREVLEQKVLGGTAPVGPRLVESTLAVTTRIGVLLADSGIQLRMIEVSPPKNQRDSLKTNIAPEIQSSDAVVYLQMEEQDASVDQIRDLVIKSGRSFVSLQLRATGSLAFGRDRVGRAVDHNSAEWALWLGRPMLGQWVQDVRAAITVLQAPRIGRRICIMGKGPAGLVAVCAAAIDDRVEHAVSIGMLGSYVSTSPYEGQRLGLFPNGILRDVGDVAHIAALVAPRKLNVIGAVHGNGNPMNAVDLQAAFEPTAGVYEMLKESEHLRISLETDMESVVQNLFNDK